MVFAKQKVLITFGSVREYIDSVRYIGSSSSGRMGIALMNELIKKGSFVSVVHGYTGITFDKERTVVCKSAFSSQEMLYQTSSLFPANDILIMVAAVSDYRPSKIIQGKIKKKHDKISLNLESTVDVLKTLSINKNKNQITIGFALEHSHDGEKFALKKLKEKKLDAIILNNLIDDEVQLGQEENKTTIFFKHLRQPFHFPLIKKEELATKIIDCIETNL